MGKGLLVIYSVECNWHFKPSRLQFPLHWLRHLRLHTHPTHECTLFIIIKCTVEIHWLYCKYYVFVWTELLKVMYVGCLFQVYIQKHLNGTYTSALPIMNFYVT